MAFKRFHSINSATDGTEVELVAAGDTKSKITSVLLTNIDTADITASLYLLEQSTGTRYYIIYNVSLPVGASLLIDDKDVLDYDTAVNGYSLNLTLGSTSDLINVLIKSTSTGF